MKPLNRHQLWISWTVLIVGLILVMSGFWVPPMGLIHPSVLTAFGEALTFVGSIIGVDYHYRFKYGDRQNGRNTDK